MRRISTVLLTAALAGAAGPSFAQDSDAPGLGSVVGGLLGSAIGAAIQGRAPRAGDVVPGIGGGGKSGAGGGGQHGHAPVGTAAPHGMARAGGGQAASVHRKPGK